MSERIKNKTHVLEKWQAPTVQTFAISRELLHLGPGVVEIEIVSRFKRTVRVPEKRLSFWVG